MNPQASAYEHLVAAYCLSEIFRAGATETGFVHEDEHLAPQTDIVAYRRRLLAEAELLLDSSLFRLPWYLRQQLQLFVGATDPFVNKGIEESTNVGDRYHHLIRFLRRDRSTFREDEYATFAVMQRRSFHSWPGTDDVGLHARRLEAIAARDPGFALEIIRRNPGLDRQLSDRVKLDLCLDTDLGTPDPSSLAEFVLPLREHNVLRNELTILTFVEAFIDAYKETWQGNAITPSELHVDVHQTGQGVKVTRVALRTSKVTAARSLYAPPSWCPLTERWRFQLGYLLRFILTGNEDFTARVPFRPDTAKRYTPLASHWFLRHYGFFNARTGFGDYWVPITEFAEQFLSGLLSWPGAAENRYDDTIANGMEATKVLIVARREDLAKQWGAASDLLVLPIRVGRPKGGTRSQPFRACVVQSVMPNQFPDPKDFKPADLTFSDAAVRKKHRRHLASALGAVGSMLDLRATHYDALPLDLLILPELSVHPDDVNPLLLPFARARKSMILAGLTYMPLRGGGLVNSAVWIIPQYTRRGRAQFLVLFQGKEHLADQESRYNTAGGVIRGFRPVQWVVGYDWDGYHWDDPLRLTASVCYDATDLRLAADLRSQSDVFIVPAYNKDVSTFDNMSLALHYHMFQLVVVANNGTYGGSSAYVPYKEVHHKQVFHLHGQPQASIGFFEIEDVRGFKERLSTGVGAPDEPASIGGRRNWKAKPAGM